MRTRAATCFFIPLFFACAAGADTITANHAGNGRGRMIRTSLDGWEQNVFAGQLVHDLSGGTGLAEGLSGRFVTFCIELPQAVTSMAREFGAFDLADARGDAYSPVMNHAKAQALSDMFGFAAGAQLDPRADRDFATAFQLAVWEVVEDYNAAEGVNSLNVVEGRLRTSLANGAPLPENILFHLDALFAAIGAGLPPERLLAITNSMAQDQIIGFVGTPAPLPSAGALGGIGLFALAARRRRPAALK